MKMRQYLARPSLLLGVLGTLVGLMIASSPSRLEGVLVPVGAGVYTTDLPPGRLPPSDFYNNPAYPKLAPDFSQLATSNKWWSSLMWNYYQGQNWSQNLYAHPLSFHAQADGIEVGYPNNYYVTPFAPIPRGQKIQEYHYGHVRDLLLSVAGLSAPDTKVSSYSDWAVTAHWSGNGRTMKATMGSGIPFVYITKSGGDAVITFPNAPTIWSNTNGVIGLTANGRHYGIFAPQGSTWAVGNNQLQSNLNGKNYYSVAVLPDNTPQTLEFFRQRAYAFVTDTKVTWNYDEKTSIVTTDFTATTTLMEPGPNNSNINHTILALYRHQWMHTKSTFLPFSYVSPRGSMKVVDANQFATTIKFNGMLPWLPLVAKNGVDTFDSNRLYGYIDEIYKQPYDARWNYINEGTDPYWSGKAMARIARLLPLADQVKHTAARDLFLAEVKAQIENWFKAQKGKILYYNNDWKTIIAYPAGFGSDIQLNDHHFHDGYFVWTASIIAHYDPNWASQGNFGAIVELLIRDSTTWNRNDPLFPYMRYFDLYAGHGWATGPAQFTVGSNEESSSEDRQYVASLILWGTITNNKAIRDAGIFMSTQLEKAIAQYWFDIDEAVFPPEFQPPTAGMIWGDGVAYSVWWDASVQEFHGINFIPIDTATLHMSKYPAYLKKNQDFMLSNGSRPDVWPDVHMAVKAFYDPISAISTFNSNPNYTPEAGESRPHTYHWLHNINRLGNQDPDITADIPTYGVFNKNGVRTHVAYNPTSQPLNVTFSDGVVLTVQAKSMATDEGGDTPTPTPTPTPGSHEYTKGATSFGEVQFWFKPNWDTKFVNLNYKINGGTLVTVPMNANNGMWQYTVNMLKNSDTIDYFYSYEDDGRTTQTTWSQHIYKDCGQQPQPTPTNIIADTADYTLKVEPQANGQAVVSFTAKKGTQTHFVDIHYIVDNNPQLNYRMANNNSVWTYTVSNLKAGSVIKWFNTYDVNNMGIDTPWYTYTYNPPATNTLLTTNSALAKVEAAAEPVEEEKGIEQDGKQLKFWFKPNKPTKRVEVQYQLGDGTQHAARLLPRGDYWEATVYNSSNSRLVDYSIGYEQEGQMTGTEWKEDALVPVEEVSPVPAP